MQFLAKSFWLTSLLLASVDVCSAFTTSFEAPKKSSALQMSDDLNPPINPKWATPLKEGDTVPSVTFKTRTRVDPATAENPENPFDWKDVTSEDYFKGKRVVLFGLPGAFTPLCSSQMVPGYDKARPELLELGIDEVYCLSVNDAFVMRQWGLAQG